MWLNDSVTLFSAVIISSAPQYGIVISTHMLIAVTLLITYDTRSHGYLTNSISSITTAAPRARGNEGCRTLEAGSRQTFCCFAVNSDIEDVKFFL